MLFRILNQGVFTGSEVDDLIRFVITDIGLFGIFVGQVQRVQRSRASG